MRFFIIVIYIFTATICLAQVKLYHYTDRVSGEERGICYSDKNGNPQNNPDWIAEEISENEKQEYIDLQTKQIKEKQDIADKEQAKNSKSAEAKLKSLGLTDDEISVMVK